MSKSEKRTKTKSLQVRMSPDEYLSIKERADAFGVSVSHFLRENALDRPLPSRVQHQAVRELAAAIAESGRVGGLLKKWLTGDWASADGHNQNIKALLKEIEATQKQAQAAMKKLGKLEG